MQAHWRLPSSKTDCTGRGCRRTWGCLCSTAAACLYRPFHLALRLISSAGKLLGSAYVFADSTAKAPSKRKVIDTLRMVVIAAGAMNASAEALVTGHSFRVTGGQHLAALGLALHLIQMLGSESPKRSGVTWPRHH